MIFLSICVFILSGALVVTSRNLSAATKRLNVVEKTLNQVVSIIAMAEPEKFNLLLTAPPAQSTSSWPFAPASDDRVQNLVSSLTAVPPHHRGESLGSIVEQNLWLSQEQFNRLLYLVPDHHRREALQNFISAKANENESMMRSLG